MENMNSRESIGKQLAELRQQKGLTIRQLAELSGVNYSNIGKIERGAYNVSIDILSKICNSIDVNIQLIFKE